MLVGQSDLGIANSRALAGVIVWNQMAGPPASAALFAIGMALPFASETVCVLAGLAMISQVRLQAHGARGRDARVRDDIREGWRWLWGHAAVRTLAITIFTVRQRAVPAEFQGRVGSVYLTGTVGGIVAGSAIGGLVAAAWGITAPFWFAFVGSALILACIWRSLLHIAHADEQARASAPTPAA